MYPEQEVAGPGVGPGWRRLAQQVRLELDPAELDGLWVFEPVRVEKKEWGTAILARAEGEDYRIYTAQYAHTIKGRDRGAFACEIKEVGSGPMTALDELVAQVPKRIEEDPPVRVPVDTWFPASEELDAAPDGS